MSNNKTCKVCGKRYYYCFNQTCNEKQPSYMALFHNENCKTIFETLNKVYFKQITEKKAIKTLKKCDLSVLENDAADMKIREKVYDLLTTPETTSDVLPKIVLPEVVDEPVILNTDVNVVDITE